MANPFGNPQPEGRQANIARTVRRRRVRAPATSNIHGNISAPSFQPPLRQPQSTPLYPPNANITHNIHDHQSYSDHASGNLIWDSQFDPISNPTPQRIPQSNVRSVFSPISPPNDVSESHNSTVSSISMEELLDQLAFTPRGPPSTRVPDFILNSRPPTSSFRFGPTDQPTGGYEPASSSVSAKRQRSMCDAAYNRIESLGREHLDPNISNNSITEIHIPTTLHPRVKFQQPSPRTGVANFNHFNDLSNTIPLSSTVSSSVPFSYIGSSAPFQSEFARGVANQARAAQTVGQLPQVGANLGTVSSNSSRAGVGAEAFKHFKYGPIAATSDNVQDTASTNVASQKAVTTSAGVLGWNLGSFNFDFGRNNDRSNVTTAPSIVSSSSSLNVGATSTMPTSESASLCNFNTTTLGFQFSNINSSTNGFNGSVAGSMMSTTTPTTPSSAFGHITPSLGVNDFSKPPPAFPTNVGGTLPKVSQENGIGELIPNTVNIERPNQCNIPPTSGIPVSHVAHNLPQVTVPDVTSAPAQPSLSFPSGLPPQPGTLPTPNQPSLSIPSGLLSQPGTLPTPGMAAPPGFYSYPSGVPGYYNQYNVPNNNSHAGVNQQQQQPFDMEFLINEVTSRLAQSNMLNNVSTVTTTSTSKVTSTSADAVTTATSVSMPSKTGATSKNKYKTDNADRRKVRTAEEPSSSGDHSSSSSSEDGGSNNIGSFAAGMHKNDSKSNKDLNKDISGVGGAAFIPNRSHRSRRRNESRNTSRFHALNLTEAERTILYRNGVTDSDIESRAIQISANNNFVANAQAPQIVYAAPHDHVSIFSGNMEDYEPWKNDLIAYVATVPDSIRFRTLNRKLPTGIQNKIAMFTGHTQEAFDLAIDELDAIYDHPTAVVQILTDQINLELDPICSNDRAKFSNMVANIRNKFNRIFAINALAISNLNGFLTQFMNCLPREVYREVAKLRHRKPAKFCFKKILEMAEDFDDLSWSQRYGAESRSYAQYHRNTSNDRYSRPSSRGSSYERSKHDTHNNNHKYNKNHNSHQVHANAAVNTNSAGSENDNIQPAVAMAVSGNDSSSSNFNNSKFKPNNNKSQDQSPRGRSPHKQSFNQPRGRSQSISRFKCLICSTNDHFTVLCPAEKESKELQEIVQERKICTYCGKGGHFNTSCYNVELGFKSDLVCQNKSKKCKDTPHVQRFCSIYQST